jgi:predicted nucleic acid-binding protein
MIVVSNTSPLTNLAAIGQFELLESLFGEVYIPLAVMSELSFGGRSWPGVAEVERSKWVHVEQVGNRVLVDALRLDLDFGEAETIALALEMQADLVLLDEVAARSAAQHFNLRMMGVVGLLVRAKKLNLIAEIRSHLDALRQQAGFYLSETVYLHALDLANE